MLWFLAAASAPILIHLWNKRRFREVDWAAMEFLLAALKSNSRKILIEQWVLLAARTLAIALLALAVSQPYFEHVGLSFVPGERTHRVVVLDGSYSMDYTPADQSRFESAKSLARSIVEASNEGDGFTLILAAEPPRTIISTPIFSAEAFLEQLDELEHPHAGADLPETFARIEQVLDDAQREHPKLVREEVYLVTDLGAQTWAPRFASAQAEAEFRRRAGKIGDDAALVVLDVGEASGGNLAVTGLMASAAAPVVGTEIEFYSQVRNFGRQQRDRVVAEFLVNGSRADQAVVDVAAEQTIELPPFRYRFLSPGENRVEVKIASDALAVDDARYLALPVRDAFRVLVIEGKPSGVPFAGATDYIQAALSSSTAAGGAPIDMDVQSELALLRRNLDEFDAVFLCNVRRFRPAEALQLRRFVERGGGLITFLGDQIMPDNYNDVLASGENRVLPARIEELIVREPADVLELDPLDYRHPLLDPFRNNEQVAFLRTPVYKSFQLRPDVETSAEVALAFTGGQPLIVEERIGRGYSILVGTSAEAGPREDLWTAMPMLQNYLPLVRQMLAISVRGQVNARNVNVGEPLSGLALPSQVERRMLVELPSNETVDIRIQADDEIAAWSYAATDVVGVYRVSPADAEATGGLYAVNANHEESDLARVSASELRDGLFADVTFTVEEEFQALGDQPFREIVRRGELFRWLLAAALALLLFEMILSWKLRSAA